MPYDDAELARLRALGIGDPEDDPTVLVEAPGTLPRLWFQEVPERKMVKNRVHLDLEPGADGFEAEIDRLKAIGARQADAQPDADLVVLLDPEGNEFCLLRP